MFGKVYKRSLECPPRISLAKTRALRSWCLMLFKILAAVSALMFVSVCALWVRSHLVRDYAWAFLPWPGDSAGVRRLKLDVDSGGGQLEVSWKVWARADREVLRGRGGIGAQDFYHRTFDEVPRQYAQSIPPTVWNRLGFKSYSGPTHTNVCVPYWSLELAATVLPGVWMVRWNRRRRRLAAGCCVACGYDLRASIGRCPECGRDGPTLVPRALIRLRS